MRFLPSFAVPARRGCWPLFAPWAGMLLILMATGCQAPPQQAALPEIAASAPVAKDYRYTPPANGYTPQSTFIKYREQYPELRLPDAALLPGVQRETDRVYKMLGQRALTCDWFMPNQLTAATAIVVLVHGGGWASGSKENFHALANHLAAQGVVSVTINYRLSGEALYPAAVEDIKDALVYVQQSAQELGLNPARVSIAGGSAGGQLAALAGLTHRRYLTSSQSAQLLPLQTIINLDGVMDFTDPAALINENDPAKQPSAAGAFFGGRYQDIAQVWRSASPNYHIDASAAPMLFIRSSVPRFSVGYAAALDRLNAVGGAGQDHVFTDAPHSYWLFDPWVAPTARLMADFIGANPPRDATSSR